MTEQNLKVHLNILNAFIQKSISEMVVCFAADIFPLREMS